MSASDGLIFLDGEMAVRIRNADLLQSASPALKATVALSLTSATPMLLWCGPELALIYNDAAISFLATAHPAALGRTIPEEHERWRTLHTDLTRAREERVVVRTQEMTLTPILDGEQVVAVVGAPLHVELDEPLSSTAPDEDQTRPRILVVDDDPDLLAYVATILADECELLTATNAEEALAHMADAPDVVVTDIRLPNLDGIGLVQAVRANPRTSHIPVILATGHASEQTRAAGIEAGADDYLVKPFAAKELRARVRLQLSLASIRAEEMRKATRAKDDFLAMVGHELRNPLSTVSTMLQALMLRGPTRELDLMGRAVRQLTRLVEDLLESSRLSRGKIQLQKKAVELAQVVDRAIEHVAQTLEENRSNVLVSVPRVGCRVEADGERLARAIANVLTNSSQHTPAGRKIVVDVTRDGDRIRLRIADEGAGISAERVGQLFQAFQSDATSGGLGLGLSIARNVVELHGGSISVTSPGSGQGTECIIELTSTSEVAAEPAPLAKPMKRRLLLVEDNDDAARALKSALEQLGYEVALAHDAPIALNLAKAFEPDVALLDLGLPVMDGWELAKRMQATRARPLPVVAVTARDQESDKQKSAELGFAEHLVKPIDLPHLQRVVERLSVSGRGES